MNHSSHGKFLPGSEKFVLGRSGQKAISGHVETQRRSNRSSSALKHNRTLLYDRHFSLQVASSLLVEADDEQCPSQHWKNFHSQLFSDVGRQC